MQEWAKRMGGSVRIFPSTSAEMSLKHIKEEANVERREQLKKRALECVEGEFTRWVFMIATIFSLYGLELWEACGPPPIQYDVIIYLFMTLVVILYLAELVIRVWCKPEYAFSFVSFLDVLSIISLLPHVCMLFKYDSFSAVARNFGQSVARAVRAAQTGTSSVRILRVVKLVQDIIASRSGASASVAKESKIGGRLAASTASKVTIVVGVMLFTLAFLDLLDTSNDGTDFVTSLHLLEDLYLKCRPNRTFAVGCDVRRTDCMSLSVHGRRALDRTNDATCHFNMLLRNKIADFNGNGGCQMETSIEANRQCKLAAFDKTYSFADYTFQGDCQTQTLRYLRLLGGDLFCSSAEAAKLRTSPPEAWDVCGAPPGPICLDPARSSRLVLEALNAARGRAVVTLTQISCTMLLLGVSTYLFQLASNQLVIKPLSKMVRLVENLCANPLAKIEEVSEGPEEYETDFVEGALKKFGGLLQVAFGEAGAAIISHNLVARGELCPMVPGRRMAAVFGFAAIRGFGACVESLQEDVMVFVNGIAAIVHEAVRAHGGAPNKNIGEAFLVAWRLPDVAGNDNLGLESPGMRRTGSHLSRSVSGAMRRAGSSALRRAGSMASGRTVDSMISGMSSRGGFPMQRTDAGQSSSNKTIHAGADIGGDVFSAAAVAEKAAESALKAVVRAGIEVSASHDLRKISEHPRIQERLPGFRVTMGFGLHVGWAIEGAIGSMHKIDASYLSPNVNLAARLQSATKQFHVDVLMSDTFFSLLSKEVQSLCRRIDCVTVKGSSQVHCTVSRVSHHISQNNVHAYFSMPMVLYTYDVPRTVESSHDPCVDSSSSASFWVKVRAPDDYSNFSASGRTDDAQQYAPSTTASYRQLFDLAVQAYIDGQWFKSKKILEDCMAQCREDPVASVLHGVLEKSEFVAPPGWKGYRKLTDK